MPKLVNRLPVMRNSAGRARVLINGRAFYLGSFTSVEAQEKFDELLRVYLANSRQIPSDWFPATKKQPVTPPPKPPTIAALVDQFLKWADSRYRNAAGQKTGESKNLRIAVKPLKEMFSHLTLPELGPNRLREIQDHLIRDGLGRTTINDRVRRLRKFVRWAVGREYAPPSVLTALECVESLEPNRGAVETPGTRGAVSWAVVEATLPHLPEMLQALVLVLWYSGARVGEIVKLTGRMIDTSREIWCATLSEHKTAWRGKTKKIYFGPRAQEALAPWLLPDVDAVIFSHLRVEVREGKRTRRKLPRKHYPRSSLTQCLRRGIKRAGVEPWSLAQLRHSAAVNATNECGLEAAQRLLGHSAARMTEHYAQAANAAALRVAKEIG